MTQTLAAINCRAPTIRADEERAGNRPATSSGDFDDQFDALWTKAFRVSYRLLGSQSAAEDVAQEALVRALERWSTIVDHAEAWVCRVAYNLVIDDARRRIRSRRWQPDQNPASSALPDERLDLVQALRRLPKRQREAVVLRHLADQPEHEVAATMGISVSTVQRNTARGLTALRALLSPDTTHLEA